MAEATIAQPQPDNNNCPKHPEYNMTCGTCNGYFDPKTGLPSQGNEGDNG